MSKAKISRALGLLLVLLAVAAASWTLVPKQIRWHGGTIAARPSAELLFVGDVMLDRGVAIHADREGIDSLFRGIAGLFSGRDAVIGNLEGTITDKEPVSRPGGPILRFTFDPMFAPHLKAVGFTAVSLANNHSMDFYAFGFAETKRRLDEAGVAHFGSANNDSGLSTRLQIGGESVCLVGYHDLYTFDESPVLSEIPRIRPECTYLAVLAHWGDEYELEPSSRQIELGRAFIDAGADLVIGAHPHVVQPVEIYQGKPIFYSLGNFMFDQNLSFWTEHGLAVVTDIRESEVRFELIPTELNKAEASVAGPEAAAKVLEVVGMPSGEFSVVR